MPKYNFDYVIYIKWLGDLVLFTMGAPFDWHINKAKAFIT